MNIINCSFRSNVNIQEQVQNCISAHDTYQNDISILIIDDDLINQKVAALFLKNYGYINIHTASTGQSALDLIQVNNYALIILDIGLPDISGIDVCAKIRNASTHNDIPVIVVSAYETNMIKNKCIAAGANRVLSKPLLLSEFEIAVKNCIGGITSRA